MQMPGRSCERAREAFQLGSLLYGAIVVDPGSPSRMQRDTRPGGIRGSRLVL